MLGKKIALSVVLGVTSGLLFYSGTVQARGWSWIERLPISQYGPEDAAIFHAHVDQALVDAADGERVEWQNPDSGHSGAIIPLTTVQLNGMRCRQTRFENQAGQGDNVSEFLLCQQPDGSWSVSDDK